MSVAFDVEPKFHLICMELLFLLYYREIIGKDDTRIETGKKRTFAH